MTPVRDTFLFKWEGKAGRGDYPGQLKKFRQGGHIFNKYFRVFFCGLHLFPGVEGKAGGGGGGMRVKANLLFFAKGAVEGLKQI